MAWNKWLGRLNDPEFEKQDPVPIETTCRECGAPGHITPGGGQLNLCTTHLEENKERAKKKRAETQKPLLCWMCPKGRKRPGYQPKHGGQKRLCKKHAYG